MPAMLMYPQFDPIAIKIGPLAVHWYGLTYLVAFGLFLLLGIRRLKDSLLHRLPPLRAGCARMWKIFCSMAYWV